MKRRIVFILLLVGLAFWAGRNRDAVAETETRAPVESGREETRQTFKMSPGARVEVRGINGPVTIETAETDTAEVHIVRTAKNMADLERHKILIEQTPESLVVRAENPKRGFWDRVFELGSGTRQQVTLRIPRKSEVKAQGVNGSLKVGEVEGGVNASGINGRVEVAQATGRAELSGINGGVVVGLSRVEGDGVRVSGINGGVVFNVGGEVNADVNVNGHNGGLSVDLPGMVIEEGMKHSRMRARIGAGGAPVTINGVNGSLSFRAAAN
ncbi:MAG TPA: hypothetical protein VGV59_07255 [Pyrinomonadaceae bacterium]|nr:hypothetical protein [Pyrinomonadaceae bacterium]